MKLIINADDFGLTDGVNKAIVESIKHGVVTSTTLMVNQQGTDNAVALIQEHNLDCVGLHINLTLGEPISNPDTIASLVDESGHFHSRKYLVENTNSIDAEHVYIEATNQYNNAISLGVDIDHIDSHHFAAFLPNIRNGFIKFANEVALPCRRADYYIQNIQELKVKTTDIFSAKYYGDRADINGLKETILELKNSNSNVAEIMAHPGYSDSLLTQLSSYAIKREQELRTLTSLEIKAWLHEQQIELIDFKGI